MSPTNNAAYLPTAKAHPFKIAPAPLGTPHANQILIKNHAIAINPIDGKLQALAIYPLSYPTILGQDVAGEVISVGPDVTRYAPGDRVIGTCTGFGTKQDTEKGFQEHTVLEVDMSCEIPEGVAYERAVVLPLGVTTAAAGLFNPEFLGLETPREPAREKTGKTVLVWGGASSVGSNAVQLAVAAGYEVVATASARNFGYVEKLGAGRVVDYNSADVVSQLVDAFKGKTLGGVFDCVGGSAWAPSVEVAQKLDGPKFVATVTPGFPEPPNGVGMKQVYSLSIRDNHVGKAVWNDFLPKALKSGKFVPAPEPLVVGTGLESIQKGIDLQREGKVSAQKVVVTL